ncbi:MAG TPA: prepilin-type N-terminal cleavage/methylation domain-containing protein, partial [Anaerovoracaceae bacterium]|nr:prepilin-type N-terminal cleavage/methylation domain-containing protein [Anaerovoracaceae bacterium]
MKSFLKGTGKGPEASACEHESPASKGKLNNMIGCVKHNRKGFSLVEMLTAVAILAILVSISIVGVIGYMNNLKATEMDSAARQIFVAAQNHLTQAKASGQWDAFVSNPTGSTTTDSGITLDEARTIGELIPEMPSDFTSDAWDNSKERYRYIEFTEETALLQSSALKYLLPFGALEEDIRTDGHYVIEYDAVAGNVYGVFYTDSNLPLEYSKVIKKLNETKGDVSGRSNTREGSKIRARYLDVDGNKYTVGYYGGAMANYLEAEVLAEPTVEIKNEERLIVEVTDPNYFKNTNSGVGYQTKVVLNVKGVESGAEKMIPLDLGDYKPTISNIVTDRSLESLHTDDGFVFYAGPSIDSSNLSQTNLVYSVVFDDITNSLQDGDTFKHGQHFAELFPEFIPGEDIVVTAECSSNHVLSTPVKGSATGNSLFESRIDVGNEATVRVANVRNIENLDNSISGLPQKIGAMDAESMDKKIVKSVVTRVIQIKDIDFKVSENNELGFYDGKSICAYNSVDPNLKFGDVKAHAAQFVPI